MDFLIISAERFPLDRLLLDRITFCYTPSGVMQDIAGRALFVFLCRRLVTGPVFDVFVDMWNKNIHHYCCVKEGRPSRYSAVYKYSMHYDDVFYY